MTKLDLIKTAVFTPDLTDLIALFFFLAFAITINLLGKYAFFNHPI
jgi:hypothetical protein